MSSLHKDESNQQVVHGTEDDVTLHARLANRLRSVLVTGKGPVEHIGGLSVVVLCSRPDWTFACIRAIVRNSSVPIEIYVIPRVGAAHTALFECYDIIQSQMPKDWAFFVHVPQPQPGIDLLNVTLQHIETDFVAILEDRIFVPSYWIESLVWPLLDDESIMVSAPTVYGEVPQELGAHLSRVKTMGDVNQVNRIAMERQYGHWHEDSDCTTACFVARTTVFSHVGRFDTTIPEYPEKLRTWLKRVLQVRYKVVTCQDIYVHKLSDFLEHHPFEEQAYSGENRIEDTNESAQMVNVVDLKTYDEGTISPLVSMVILHSNGSDDDLVRTWKSVSEQTYDKIEIVLVDIQAMAHSASINRTRVKPDVMLRLKDKSLIVPMWGAIDALCQGTYIGCVESGTFLSRHHIYHLVDILYRSHALAGFRVLNGADAAVTRNHPTDCGMIRRRSSDLNGLMHQWLCERDGILTYTLPSEMIGKIQVIYRDQPYAMISEE